MIRRKSMQPIVVIEKEFSVERAKLIKGKIIKVIRYESICTLF